jgi:hypothetical protein
MRVRIAIGVVLVAAGVGLAFTVNPKGTAGAPKSVSSSAVTIMDANIHRTAWCVLPETVDIRCMFGGIESNTAPTITPTTTVGYLFVHGTQTCANTGFNSNRSASVDPEQRVDCISTGAATSVDVIATP